ncbi:MAG: hypothetical protein JXR58_02130, partial [Bacteroidales bacterium]|nr:hypothetical protein [Bacteroidales bacterium]
NKMIEKVKNYISFSLLVIFLLPLTIKLFDGLFHHHEHFHCAAKNEKQFHKQHEKCPILNFELSYFSAESQFQPSPTLSKFVELIDLYNFTLCCEKSKYSFLLRAPPKFSNKEIAS